MALDSKQAIEKNQQFMREKAQTIRLAAEKRIKEATEKLKQKKIADSLHLK